MDDTRHSPTYGPDISIENPAYLDPTARLYGKISLGEECSLWPYAVIRAEAHEVRLGRYVNMQDHAMIHIGFGMGTTIGDYCSITHKATVHGATIGENTLIGINATVMDGAQFEAVARGRNARSGFHEFLLTRRWSRERCAG